jgi:hypothetical protein
MTKISVEYLPTFCTPISVTALRKTRDVHNSIVSNLTDEG